MRAEDRLIVDRPIYFVVESFITTAQISDEILTVVEGYFRMLLWEWLNREEGRSRLAINVRNSLLLLEWPVLTDWNGQ